MLRQNRSARVLPFENDVVDVPLNPRDTVLTNAAKLAAVGGGPHGRAFPQRGAAAPSGLAVRVGFGEVAEAAVGMYHVAAGIPEHAGGFGGVDQVAGLGLEVVDQHLVRDQKRARDHGNTGHQAGALGLWNSKALVGVFDVVWQVFPALRLAFG